MLKEWDVDMIQRVLKNISQLSNALRITFIFHFPASVSSVEVMSSSGNSTLVVRKRNKLKSSRFFLSLTLFLTVTGQKKTKKSKTLEFREFMSDLLQIFSEYFWDSEVFVHIQKFRKLTRKRDISWDMSNITYPNMAIFGGVTSKFEIYENICYKGVHLRFPNWPKVW